MSFQLECKKFDWLWIVPGAEAAAFFSYKVAIRSTGIHPGRIWDLIRVIDELEHCGIALAGLRTHTCLTALPRPTALSHFPTHAHPTALTIIFISHVCNNPCGNIPGRESRNAITSMFGDVGKYLF